MQRQHLVNSATASTEEPGDATVSLYSILGGDNDSAPSCSISQDTKVAAKRGISLTSVNRAQAGLPSTGGWKPCRRIKRLVLWLVVNTVALLIYIPRRNAFLRDLAKHGAAPLEAQSQRDIYNVTMDRQLPHSQRQGLSSIGSNKSEPKNSSPPFLAACLLIMDDNHRLPEWLAYHYHMLPLRYLVVMVDPRSQTSPSSILQRWRNNSDMTIHQWKGTERFWRESIAVDPSIETDPNRLRAMHVRRQQSFYQACVSHLQEEFSSKQDQLWTAIWDIDEFLFFNYNVISDSKQLAQEPGTISRFLQSGVVRDWNVKSGEPAQKHASDRIPPHFQNIFRPCTLIPRVTLSAVENINPEQDVVNSNPASITLPSWLDAQKFETLRWRFYDNETRNMVPSSYGKSVMDVLHPASKEYAQSGRIFEVHRIMGGPYCPMLPPPRSNAALLLHHYMGSWEYYSARKADSRRGTMEHSRAVWEMNSKVADLAMDTADQRAWVSGFVQSVGEDKARLLLQGSGIIDGGSTEGVDWNITVSSIVDEQYKMQRVD